MLTILVIVLIIYVLWLLKPLLVRKAQERAARYFAEQINRSFTGQSQPHQNASQGSPDIFSFFFSSMDGFSAGGTSAGGRSYYNHSRSKIFTKDMGEYIEFEELDGTFQSDRDPSARIEKESQISDAEWEEIR
ncbi:MAG: DUF4834 family protein [Lachnoclostridium sp.]|nr:DUF4834 family protein [Lachnoclostridium sp.]